MSDRLSQSQSKLILFQLKYITIYLKEQVDLV